MRLKNCEGFTLIEVMISLGIIGLATLALTSVMQIFYNASSKSDVKSVILELQLRTYFAQESVDEWIYKITNPSLPIYYTAELASCLVDPVSGVTPVCPKALTSLELAPYLDSELKTYLALGKTISAVAYKDTEARPIAGTLSSPLYFGKSGQIVTDRSLASLVSVGFLVRDNASGDPGKVVLLNRIASIVNNQEGTYTKTVWLRLNLGTRWRLISGAPNQHVVQGSCDAGQYVSGVDTVTGQVTCMPIETHCGASQYAYGINMDGSFKCLDLPPTSIPSPYVPPKTFSCDSWGYLTANCTIPGGKPILALSVNQRRSEASCAIGGNVSFSGSTITVTNGCRATFNVYY